MAEVSIVTSGACADIAGAGGSNQVGRADTTILAGVGVAEIGQLCALLSRVTKTAVAVVRGSLSSQVSKSAAGTPRALRATIGVDTRVDGRAPGNVGRGRCVLVAKGTSPASIASAGESTNLIDTEAVDARVGSKGTFVQISLAA